MNGILCKETEYIPSLYMYKLKYSSPGWESCDAIDQGTWKKFWWYKSQSSWPTGENDVLGKKHGYCNATDTYCFQRLPDNLEEDYTELMAVDGSGNTRYKWSFDSSNEVAHAAWMAFRHGLSWKSTCGINTLKSFRLLLTILLSAQSEKF